MASARQQSEWLRTGVMAAWVCAALSGKQVHPYQIIPPQFRPPRAPERPKSAAERESESKRAWALVDKFFGSMGKGKKKVPGKVITQKIVLHKE